MDKLSFYTGKEIAHVEWWLHDCDLPALTWARLRAFDDGTADACWTEGTTLYGFSAPEFAGYFMAEDEYRRVSSLDDEDAVGLGVNFSVAVPPTWTDTSAQPFEYSGTY